MSLRKALTLLISSILVSNVALSTESHNIKTDVILQTTQAWDGIPYISYPATQPKISVLKITIPAHTTLNWHTHPMPNAAYVISGKLTVEKKTGEKKHFTQGEALAETVNSVHRGITGDLPVTLIIFYAGTADMPLSESKQPKIK